MEDAYFLLSSAARPQYAEDIIRVLALPRGARLQFRYVTSIISNSVLEDIESHKIEGSTCIISFLDSNETGEPPNIIPCRRAKVISAGLFGPFAVMVFEVDVFIYCPEIKSFTESLRTITNNETPEWVPADSDMDLAGKWVLHGQVPELNYLEGYEISIFSKVVDTLSELYPFKDDVKTSLNPFYHVSLFDLFKNRNLLSFSQDDLGRSIRLTDGTLSFRSSHKYLLRVHHYYARHEKLTKEYTRKMLINLNGISPQYEEQIERDITSEYDVTEEYFRTLSTPLSQSSNVYIALENTSISERDGRFADIRLPVLLEGSMGWAIVQVMLIGVGVAMPGLISASYNSEFGLWAAFGILFAGIVVGFAAVFGLRKSL